MGTVVEQRTWLTPREAANLLGIPLRDLYRLVDHGEVPAHVFGRRLRLWTEDVAGYRESPPDRPRDEPPDEPLLPALPT